MNFTKRNVQKKQKNLTSASKKAATKSGIIIFRLFIIGIIACIIIGGYAAYGLFQGILSNTPDLDLAAIEPSGFATTIYNSNGKEIQKLIGSDANREEVTLEDIPDYVQKAFIAIEDERFYTHTGIDMRGIFRAGFIGILHRDFSQGASTITQQLIKNQIFSGGNEASFADKLQRKIQEQYLATKLEKSMGKNEILENYLNTINLGQNTLGVQAASKRYFGKDVQELTLSEAAVIAGITKNPSELNPITYPENNEKRRKEILNKMLELEFISEKEYNKALKDNVYARIEKVNSQWTAEGSNVNSYFVDELINQVIADLQEDLGYSSTQAYNLLYRGGLSIYTTQNTRLQKICDDVLSNESLYPANSTLELTYRLSVYNSKTGETTHYNEGMLSNYFKKQNSSFSLNFTNKADAKEYIKKYKKHVMGKNDSVEAESISFALQPQISFVLIEQSTGEVKALVGGRGAKTANRTMNRATDSMRQPGSTFKILSTYLPALDNIGMSLATAIDDAAYNYPGTKRPVQNWSKNGYKGLTTIRNAIKDSMNVVAVKTLEQVTPRTGFSYLQKLGFTTLVENEEINGKIYSDISLPTALGGLTKGVKNIELTAAFAAVANGGVYTEPVYYTKIVDHDGNILIDHTTKTSQVMKTSTAWLLTSAMQDVVTSGTGTLTKFTSVDMPVAGKTGTTSGNVDLWFVGYTPYYTAGIWSGYDNNLSQTNTTYHKVLWRTIMEKMHENLEKRDFKKPDNIVKAKICTKSGKLAKPGVCENAAGGSTVITEYFADAAPTEYCDCHVLATVCSASNLPPSSYCPHNQLISKVLLVKKESSTTADTPYVLAPNYKSKVCTYHGYSSIPSTTVPEEDTPTSKIPAATAQTPSKKKKKATDAETSTNLQKSTTGDME